MQHQASTGGTVIGLLGFTCSAFSVSPLPTHRNAEHHTDVKVQLLRTWRSSEQRLSASGLRARTAQIAVTMRPVKAD